MYGLIKRKMMNNVIMQLLWLLIKKGQMIGKNGYKIMIHKVLF